MNRRYLLFIIVPWIVAVSVARSQDIIEEQLPPVTTLTEIERELDILIDGMHEKKYSDLLSEIQSVREKLHSFLAFHTELNFSEKQQADALEEQLDMFEGAVHYQHKRYKRASRVFRRVFRRNPGAAISGDYADARLARYFERIRGKSVGTLSVTTTPPDCELYIDDTLAGVTPIIGLQLGIGERRIRIEHPGYEMHEERVRIDPGKEYTLAVTLEKNSGTLCLMTEPVGVTVTIDDTPVGSTSGSLAYAYAFYPGLFGRAIESGLDPFAVSRPLIIDFIPPGTHVLRLTSPCYEPVRMEIVMDQGLKILPPVALKKALSYITVISEATPGVLFIDGERVGELPVKDYEVCSGTLTLEVTFGDAGRWMKIIDAAASQRLEFHAFPRPALLLVGCSGIDVRHGERTASITGGWLDSLDMFNFSMPALRHNIMMRPDMAAFLETVSGELAQGEINWNTLTRLLPEVIWESGTDLLGIVASRRVDAHIKNTLYLLAPHQHIPDRIPLPDGFLPEKFPSSVKDVFIMAGSRHTSRLDIGLQLVDYKGRVVVAGIRENSPCFFTPIHLGDTLLEVNGQGVHSQCDVVRMLDILPEEKPVELKIQSSGGVQTFSVRGTRQPVTFPLFDPSYQYNLQLARLKARAAAGYTGPETSINIGICHLALGRPDAALREGFEACTLPDGPGISGGTLDFLKALAYRLSEDTVTAGKYAARVMRQPEATFIDAEGPRLTDLVRDLFPSVSSR